MNLRTYDTGEIEVMQIMDGHPHFNVLRPGDFDSAATFGPEVAALAADAWTPNVIAVFEAAAEQVRLAAEATL